jgi:hypothetical protein
MSLATNLPTPTSTLVWHKVNSGAAGNTKHEHTRDYEMALFYAGPEHKFKKRPKSVLTYRPPETTFIRPRSLWSL